MPIMVKRLKLAWAVNVKVSTHSEIPSSFSNLWSECRVLALGNEDNTGCWIQGNVFFLSLQTVSCKMRISVYTINYLTKNIDHMDVQRYSMGSNRVDVGWLVLLSYFSSV